MAKFGMIGSRIMAKQVGGGRGCDLQFKRKRKKKKDKKIGLMLVITL